MFDFNKIAAALKAAREILDSWKALKAFKEGQVEVQLSTQQAVQKLELKLDQAEQNLEQEKLKFAKAIGYPLCRCTFPPTIVIKHPERGIYLCENCGERHPDPKDGGGCVLRS